MGEDVEKRNTENPTSEETVTDTPKPKASDKQLWGQSQVAILIKNMIEHKDDQKKFLDACKGIKSEAKTTDKFIYKSKAFSEKQILSKAQQVVKRMRADGYSVDLPKKKREGDIDYTAIYTELGLTPKGKIRKKS